MNMAARNNNCTVIYLAHGVDSGKYQAIISIYSLFHHLSPDTTVEVVIYTDDNHKVFDKYLSGLPVKLETLTKEQVNFFKGENDYLFRIKPCIIKDYFSKHSNTVFYIDTDTFFLKNPTDLFDYISPGYTIMNAEEYNFLDGGKVELLHWFTLRQALKRHAYTVQGKKVDIPLSTTMWNSGIIGINYADSSLIEQSIGLIDEMYSRSQTFNIEQLAVSYILQSATQLRATDDYINHYWLKEIKNSFNLQTPYFLQQSVQKSGRELYASAFEFAKKVSQIQTPIQESLISRMNARLKLIVKVARNGHL